MELWDSLLGSARENPWGATGVGLGAVGTGLGVWDMIRANQAAQERDFAAKHWLRAHPVGDYTGALETPEAMQAALRPTIANAAASGIDMTGGAGRQAWADAAAKLHAMNLLQGTQQQQMEFGTQFGGGGQYMNQPSPMGTLGGLGQSLTMMQLMAALRHNPPTPPAVADTQNLPGLAPQQPRSFYPAESYGPSPAQGFEGAWSGPLSMSNPGFYGGGQANDPYGSYGY